MKGELEVGAHISVSGRQYVVVSHDWGPTYTVRELPNDERPDPSAQRLQAYDWDEPRGGVYRIAAFSGPI